MAYERPNPYQITNFTVEIDDLYFGGFEKVSGLTVRMEVTEYREGGVNDHVHRLPGQYSHSNLVLENGMTDAQYLWGWIEGLKRGAVSHQDARRNVTIKMQKNYKNEDVWGWELSRAYPVQWDGPDLLSQPHEPTVALQTLELAHEGFTKLTGGP